MRAARWRAPLSRCSRVRPRHRRGAKAAPSWHAARRHEATNPSATATGSANGRRSRRGLIVQRRRSVGPAAARGCQACRSSPRPIRRRRCRRVVVIDDGRARLRAADGLGPVLWLRRALQHSEQIAAVLRGRRAPAALRSRQAASQKLDVANAVGGDMMLADQVGLQRGDAVGAAVEGSGYAPRDRRRRALCGHRRRVGHQQPFGGGPRVTPCTA